MPAPALALHAPAAPARAPVDPRGRQAVLDVVVPVYSEEADLPAASARCTAT